MAEELKYVRLLRDTNEAILAGLPVGEVTVYGHTYFVRCWEMRDFGELQDLFGASKLDVESLQGATVASLTRAAGMALLERDGDGYKPVHPDTCRRWHPSLVPVVSEIVSVFFRGVSVDALASPASPTSD